jgi:exodeoxyribonuclease V alpha subunit
VLTGGPGCGKTFTTKTIVALWKAMGKSILLATPTGRAAQRLAEMTGQEAKTIHRLLL